MKFRITQVKYVIGLKIALLDPYEDQFAKLSQAKKERRAKNELQRLRNIARTVKAGQGKSPTAFSSEIVWTCSFATKLFT